MGRGYAEARAGGFESRVESAALVGNR